jgi:hypothetical protein
MTAPRRRVLALAGTAVTVGLAGCGAEAKFLVTNIQPIHRPGDDRFDYPEDILYRVSIENTGPDRAEGTLDMTLTHDAGNETETWSKQQEVSVSRGTAALKMIVFENVFQEGNDIDNYSLEAEIVQ